MILSESRSDFNLSPYAQGMLLGFLAVVLFAMTLPATQVSVQYFDPFTIGFGRSAIASVVAGVLLYAAKAKLPTKRQFILLACMSSGVVFGFPILTAVSMQYVEAGHAGVILGILPLSTAVFAALLTGEHCKSGFWFFSVMGAVVVAGYAFFKSNSTFTVGDIITFIAVILAGVGYSLGGKLSKEVPPWQVICWALVITSPITWAGYLYFGVSPLEGTPLMGWGSFIYLALVSQLFGFFLWNKGLVLGGVSQVSQTQLLQPFITLLVAGSFLQEEFGFETLIAAVLVVLSVYLGKKFNH